LNKLNLTFIIISTDQLFDISFAEIIHVPVSFLSDLTYLNTNPYLLRQPTYIIQVKLHS